MNKPITISDLNRINTIKNQDEYNELIDAQALDKCILEINNLLKRYWHRIGTESYIFLTRFECGYNAFNSAKELFLKEGLYLSYYQPNCMLSVKKTANE